MILDIKYSLSWNIFLALFLHLINGYIIYFYKTEICKNIIRLYLPEKIILQIMMETLFSVMYALIYIVLLYPLGLERLISIKLSGTTIEILVSIIIIITLAKKKILINTSFSNKIFGIVGVLLIGGIIPLKNYMSKILFILTNFTLGFLFIRTFKKITNLIPFEQVYSSNSKSIVIYFKRIMYPITILFNYSLIFYHYENETDKKFLRIRIAISPLINTSLLLLCFKAYLNIQRVYIALATGVILFLIFLICSKNRKFINFLNFYSYALSMCYLYFIAKLQIHIGYRLSNLYKISSTKLLTMSLSPLIASSGIIMSYNFYSYNCKKFSILFILFKHVANIFIFNALSWKYSNSNTQLLYSNKFILEPFLMNCGIIFIWYCYSNIYKGKIKIEILQAFIYLLSMHYFLLYKVC